MKNKVLIRTVSVVLSVIMLLSMCTVGMVSVSAGGVLGLPALPGSGILEFIGGRVFNEFTSYCISNDVPYLGDAFYFALYGPAQRSTVKTNKTVQEINATVNEIKKDVTTTLENLDEIKDTVTVGFAKADYENKLIKLQNIENKYRDTCSNYFDASFYTYQAKYLRNEMKSKEEAGTLSEQEKKNYEANITALDKNADVAVKSFILNYQEDIMSLQNNVVSVENPAQYVKERHFDGEMSGVNNAIVEYLYACEALLRASCEFEHEITENMMSAYEYCEKIETQIYSVHEAYAAVNAVDNNKNNFVSTTDEIPDKDDLLDFSKEKEVFSSYLYNQVEVCNLDELMVTQEFIDKKQKEYEDSTGEKTSIVGGEYNPPVVETTVQIAGKTVPCYKVRDNKSLDYLLITQQAEPYSSTIKSWKNGINTTVYRPNAVLEQKYIDDSNYKMISSLSEIPSLNTTNNLLSYLRANECFTKIDQGVDGILLDNCSYKTAGVMETGGIWNVAISGVGKYNGGKPDESVNTYSSKDLYNNKEDTCIRIYRNVNEDSHFDNKTNVWAVKDINELPSVIAIHDGQILDLSKITASPKNPTTIIASGKCTIIGKTDITYNNVNIIINTCEQVTIENLNTKCTQYGTPIEVKTKDSKINFKGNNAFNGNGGTVDKNIYCQYDYDNNPVGASQGMLIDKGASVTITGGDVTFNGCCGGAGICTWGDLRIKDATITANGSQQEVEMRYVSPTLDGCISYGYVDISSLGSGIGSSVGYCPTDTLSQTYTSYGKIYIENSTVTANGVNSNADDTSYSQDIGGLTFVNKITKSGDITPDYKIYYKTITCSGGNISNSTVTTKNSRIDSNITKTNNIYAMDTYTITTVTAGSNGVTNDGISIKVYGSKGVTEWMNLSSLGDSIGAESATIPGAFVGNIDYIEVKVNSSSNSWYPEKITVKSLFAGDEVTFYGGRWINENKTYKLKQDDNVFEVNIKTGTKNNSGTDYDVYAQILDSKGNTTNWTNLSDIHPAKNAFEKGDNATFYIYAPSEFGKSQFIEMESKSYFPIATSDWYIDDITVTQVQGKYKDDSFTVNADQWDVNYHVMTFGREKGKVGTFDIEVKTSSKTGAGTDASIVLKLIGTDGYTDDVIYIDDYVESYTPGNNFEKGDTDKFRITFDLSEKGLGDIKGICVINNGDFFGADWRVDYINVTEILPDGSKGKTYQFDINDWIDSGKKLTKYI